jgi:GAF domain-containing protein
MSTTSRLVEINGQTVGVSNTFEDVSSLMAEKRALSTFTQLSQVLTNPAKERDLLASLCSEIVLLGGYALAWIGVVNEGDDPRIEIEASAGDVEYLYVGQDEASEHGPNGLGFTSTAMRTRQVQISNDLARDSHGEAWRERAQGFGFGSVVAIPITIGDELLAVLTIYGREAAAFDGPSEILLAKLATAFSLGLAHLRDTRRLAAAFDGTLHAIGRMAEVRDPYTAGHQRHVGNLGAAIARHLGLATELVDLIRQSGEVHDIGKFSIPAEILNRPGSLEPEEFALIKRHAEVGFKILVEASVPWPLAEVAHQHHERLDGSGYQQDSWGIRSASQPGSSRWLTWSRR